jgi:ABC-type transport system involved in multi-copper enzyme maturation permease subunit
MEACKLATQSPVWRNSALVIARLTFREAARRWIAWVALIMGALFLAVYSLGYREIYKEIIREGSSQLQLREFANFLQMMGLYAVNFLTLIIAVLTSVDTLAGEINSGTIHTLVSKPIRRWQIVIGKWLGFGGMLSLYLLLMGGGVILAGYIISGTVVHNLAQGLFLMWMNVILVLSISICGGAIMSTLANGVLTFGLYGVAFIGGWVEQFGALMQNPTAVNIGIISSLIMPSEALWKRAAYEMQSPIAATFGMTPFSSISTPSPLMLVYAAHYAVSALCLGIYFFNKRDL